MSSMVSRRPSLRNQSKDSRWMSIRLGRSRTCLRREKDLRAAGAVTVWAKEIVPPLGAMRRGAKREEAANTACGQLTGVVRLRTYQYRAADPPAANSSRRGSENADEGHGSRGL